MESQLINHIFPVKSLESNQIKVVANSFLALLVNLNNDTLDTVISLQSVVIFLTFLEIYIILEYNRYLMNSHSKLLCTQTHIACSVIR